MAISGIGDAWRPTYLAGADIVQPENCKRSTILYECAESIEQTVNDEGDGFEMLLTRCNVVVFSLDSPALLNFMAGLSDPGDGPTGHAFETMDIMSRFPYDLAPRVTCGMAWADHKHGMFRVELCDALAAARG